MKLMIIQYKYHFVDLLLKGRTVKVSTINLPCLKLCKIVSMRSCYIWSKCWLCFFNFFMYFRTSYYQTLMFKNKYANNNSLYTVSQISSDKKELMFDIRFAYLTLLNCVTDFFSHFCGRWWKILWRHVRPWSVDRDLMKQMIVNCKFCGNSFLVNLPFAQNFFLLLCKIAVQTWLS